MSLEAVADAFFAAIENGDVHTLNRLYDDDAAIWHNFDGVVQTKAQGIQTLMHFCAVADSKYIVEERFVVGDRLMQRHKIHIRSKASKVSTIVAVCIFMTIRQGKVVKIYEYLDSAHLAPEVIQGIEKAVVA